MTYEFDTGEEDGDGQGVEIEVIQSGEVVTTSDGYQFQHVSGGPGVEGHLEVFENRPAVDKLTQMFHDSEHFDVKITTTGPSGSRVIKVLRDCLIVQPSHHPHPLNHMPMVRFDIRSRGSEVYYR